MNITIWRKRTHNLICGPSSFLEGTPARREHLQLLLKTKNSSWTDFLSNEMWEELKRSSRSIVKQWCSIVLSILTQPGGKHKQYSTASYWGTLGRVEEQERDWKKKIEKGLSKTILDGYRGGICPSRQCRQQCKVFASGVNFSIFTNFLCFFLTKTVEIR